MANRWWNYVVRVAGTDKQTQIERTTGINQSNLSRWKAGADPTPKHVRALARAFDRPVLEAFVEAGFLDANEIGSAPHLVADLSTVSHQALVAEVDRRLKQLDVLVEDARFLRAVDQAAHLTREQLDRVRTHLIKEHVEEEYVAEGEEIERWPDRLKRVLTSFSAAEAARFLLTNTNAFDAVSQIADEREAEALGVTVSAFHDVWAGDIVKLRRAVLGTDERLDGDSSPNVPGMAPAALTGERAFDEAHDDGLDVAAHEEVHDIEDEQGHDEHP